MFSRGKMTTPTAKIEEYFFSWKSFLPLGHLFDQLSCSGWPSCAAKAKLSSDSYTQDKAQCFSKYIRDIFKGKRQFSIVRKKFYQVWMDSWQIGFSDLKSMFWSSMLQIYDILIKRNECRHFQVKILPLRECEVYMRTKWGKMLLTPQSPARKIRFIS